MFPPMKTKAGGPELRAEAPQRARLNFGDCMPYAVAKVHDVPLLYKGSDFSHTDIRPARP